MRHLRRKRRIWKGQSLFCTPSLHTITVVFRVRKKNSNHKTRWSVLVKFNSEILHDFRSRIYLKNDTRVAYRLGTFTIVVPREAVDIFIERFEQIFIRSTRFCGSSLDAFFPERPCLLCSDRGVKIIVVLRTISTRKGREKRWNLCRVFALKDCLRRARMYARGRECRIVECRSVWFIQLLAGATFEKVPPSSSSPFRVLYNR